MLTDTNTTINVKSIKDLADIIIKDYNDSKAEYNTNNVNGFYDLSSYTVKSHHTAEMPNECFKFNIDTECDKIAFRYSIKSIDTKHLQQLKTCLENITDKLLVILTHNDKMLKLHQWE